MSPKNPMAFVHPKEMTAAGDDDPNIPEPRHHIAAAELKWRRGKRNGIKRF